MAPPARACLPLGRRVHHIKLLKFMDIAGILQRLHHLMLAPTQAVATLISKWEWRFTEVFFRAIRDFQHLLIHN